MSERKKSCGGRMILSEAVLCVREREGIKLREKKAFEDLDGRTKK